MNCTEYVEEGLNQLSDPKFYKKVDSDYTHKHNELVQLKVEQMFKDKDIKDSVRMFLKNEKPRTSQFYLLPKIHKRLIKPPGHPTVSAND